MTIEVKALNAMIKRVATAEKTTKQVLGEFSRSVLDYVLVSGTTNDKNEPVGSMDIQPVNRMLAVLTPMNRKTAVLFFAAHLPFQYDEKENKFLAGIQKRHKDSRIEKTVEFLADENNTIWTWAESNIRIEAKPVDYAKNISKWVGKALNDEERPLDPTDVFKAVLEGGLTEADILQIMREMAKANAEQEKEAA